MPTSTCFHTNSHLKKNFSRLDYGSRTMTPPCISRLAEWYWEAPVSNQKVGCFESKCIALSISAPAAFRHRFSASVQTAEWQVLRHAETCWDMLRPLKSFKENWDAKCDARNCSEVLTVQSHSMSSRLEVTGGGPCSLTARLYPWALRRK